MAFTKKKTQEERERERAEKEAQRRNSAYQNDTRRVRNSAVLGGYQTVSDSSRRNTASSQKTNSAVLQKPQERRQIPSLQKTARSEQEEENRNTKQNVQSASRSFKEGKELKPIGSESKSSGSNVDEWIQSDYKLSKEEVKKAKEITSKFYKEHPEFNSSNTMAKVDPRSDLAKEAMKMATLRNKTSLTGQIGAGLMDTVKLASNAILGAGKAAAKDEETKQAIDELGSFFDASKANAQRQNGLAYGAGKTAGKMAQYMATNPVFDRAAESLGATTAAGKFLTNQLGQNAQDLALDTIPTLVDYARDGSLSAEERKDLAKNVGMNVVGNLAIPAIGAAGKGIASVLRANGMPDVARAAAGVNIDDILKNQGEVTDSLRKVENFTPYSTDFPTEVPGFGANRYGFSDYPNALNVVPLKEQVATLPNGPLKKQLNQLIDESASAYGHENTSTIDDVLDAAFGEEGWKQTVHAAGGDIDFNALRNRIDAIPNETLRQEYYGVIKASEDAVKNGRVNDAREALDTVFNDENWNFAMGRAANNTNSGRLDLGLSKFASDSKGYAKAVEKTNAFEEALQKYRNGEITKKELQQAHNDAKYAMRDLSGEIKDAAYKADPEAKATVKEAKANIREIKRSLGVRVGDKYEITISKKDLANFKKNKKENAEKILERLNKSVSAADVKFKVAGKGEASVHLSQDNYNRLVESHNIIKQAKNKDSGIGNYWDALRGAYDEAVMEVGDAASAAKAMDDTDLANRAALSQFVPNEEDVPDADAAEDILRQFRETNDIPDDEAVSAIEELPGLEQGTRQTAQELPGLNRAEQTVQEQIPGINNINATVDNVNESVNPNAMPEVDVDRISRSTPLEDELRERGYHESSRERGAIPEDIKKALNEQDSIDNNMYHVAHNVDTENRAIDLFNNTRTFDEAEKTLSGLLDDMDPAASSYARRLVSAYSKAGQTENATKVMDEVAEAMTKAGRFSQSAVLGLAKDDPMTALRFAEKQLEDINKSGLKRFGKKWKDFSLTDSEIEAFNNIQPGDTEAISQMFDSIGKRIGKDYPVDTLDKLTEARRISMLFNVRTNVRNILANVPTVGMRWVSDRVEAVGQNIAHIINPDFEVTQSLTGSGILNRSANRKLATDVFNSKSVQDLLEGSSKYNEIPSLSGNMLKEKQVFKGTAFSKFINKVTNDGLERLNKKFFDKEGVESIAETIRNTTYKVLDMGDSPFVRENFVERLASYINAQGIKSVDEIPQEAIQTAYEESMKATYKDTNFWSEKLKDFKKNHGSAFWRITSDAVFPFSQTPGALLQRSIDYSPIGSAKGISNIIKGATNNNEQAVRQGIEELSKGVSGAAAIAAGIALHNAGIITGAYSTDKDEKAQQQKEGFKEYAIHIGNKYYTYDWALPFAGELIAGTAIADAINKSDSINDALLQDIGAGNDKAELVKNVGNGLWSASKATINAWFNTSPLTAFQDLMNGGYGESDIASNLVKAIGSDYFSSFQPSVMGAVARTVDPVQRNTYDKTSGIQSEINTAISHVPGLSDTLPAKYDTWGNEVRRAENRWSAFVANFLSPGEYSYDKATELDREIDRVYESTGNVQVFPQVAPTSVKIGGENVTLNNRQVSELQRDMGKLSYEMASTFTSSDAYKNLSDVDKADTISKLYGLSKAITLNKLYGNEIASTYQKPAEIYSEKGSQGVVDFMRYKSEANYNGNGSISKDEAIAYLNSLNISAKDKQYWFDKLSTAKNPFDGTNTTAKYDPKKVVDNRGKVVDTSKPPTYQREPNQTAEAINSLFSPITADAAEAKDYEAIRAAMKENYVGNVDINHRPIVINDDGSYSTTETSFQEKKVGDGYRIAHFTPITTDGKFIPDAELNQYIDDVLNAPDPMAYDKAHKGIVYKVDTNLKDGQKITDGNLKKAFDEADAWDVEMHDRQDRMYAEEAQAKLASATSSTANTYQLSERKKNSASYERYQELGDTLKGYKISDKDYDDMFKSIDADNNESIKKAEVVAYLDSRDDLSAEEKSALFKVYAHANWNNPYAGGAKTSGGSSSGKSSGKKSGRSGGKGSSKKSKKLTFQKYNGMTIPSLQKIGSGRVSLRSISGGGASVPGLNLSNINLGSSSGGGGGSIPSIASLMSRYRNLYG